MVVRFAGQLPEQAPAPRAGGAGGHLAHIYAYTHPSRRLTEHTQFGSGQRYAARTYSEISRKRPRRPKGETMAEMGRFSLCRLCRSSDGVTMRPRTSQDHRTGATDEFFLTPVSGRRRDNTGRRDVGTCDIRGRIDGRNARSRCMAAPRACAGRTAHAFHPSHLGVSDDPGKRRSGRTTGSRRRA